jgi:polyisoprenoid-binding protein YceI
MLRTIFSAVSTKVKDNFKQLLLTAVLLGTTSVISAQAPKWTFDKSHCKFNFSVTHFGISETEGQFKKFEGTVDVTKDDFSDAKFSLTIDANSLDSEDKDRDAHLKSADFFDVTKYPAITFTTKSFKAVNKTKYKLTGDLTIHGVTKTVTLDAVYNGTILKDPFGNTRAGFKFTGVINRKDFGLVWNKALDAGGVAVGEEVRILCNIELLKSK